MNQSPAQQPPAKVGDKLADIDTPALLLELDPYERNLATMANTIKTAGKRLRAHAKAHKTPQIARQQVAAGAVGVCCQKVSEAEVMADGGIKDILISNEVVGAAKLKRVARLANQVKLSICVDNAQNVADLSRAVQSERAKIDVLVEIDVGAIRCGVAPGEQAVELARLIGNHPGLRFAGLQAYHGKAQHLRTVSERQAAIAETCRQVKQTLDLLHQAGLPAEHVTGGGTGTFIFELASGLYTEAQCGSYVFMDADYGQNDWAGFPKFENSLYIWTTVMSAPVPERRVVDAGTKAHSFDSGPPVVADFQGVKYTRDSDEHGVLEVDPGAMAPAYGSKIRLIPGHCDPTVNLYDWLVCVREGKVEALWPIAARGCSS